MVRKVNFIKEINDSKDTWKLKVRVSDVWRVDRSSAPSVEMIFLDEKVLALLFFFKTYYGIKI
ncbi:unnamed protein product [Lupinus luteus]|uniref:DUF223 domain-containing protein n=1 Tax=Lupinus luteus TaxID=3873 RepID=A0AAV1XPE0_LUPLU